MLAVPSPVVAVLAHAGQPLAPHDLWGAWAPDPPLLAGLVAAGWLYRRGTAGRPVEGWRVLAFYGGLAVVVVALLSPLEALSGVLASAHMVQHLLLVLAAAPLLALAAPGRALLAGSPHSASRWVGGVRRRLHVTPRTTRLVLTPVVAWLAHAGTLWFWHGAVPYGAALDHGWVHVLEHATFLGTAVLFWRTVVGRLRSSRVAPGVGILLVFTMGLQSVFLSLLLTFARSPWYAGYTSTTAAWGLDPLADQQLAGAVMWVPGGAVYLAVALALLVGWLRSADAEAPARAATDDPPAPPAVRAAPRPAP